MEVTAQAKYIKISPRKVRVVAEAVKELSPSVALSQLALMPRRAGDPIAKVLQSAIANAKNNAKLPLETLAIKAIVVGGGTALKRWRPVSRGRVHPYKKRTSHIRVVLTDEYSKKQIPAGPVEVKTESKEVKKGEKRGAKG